MRCCPMSGVGWKIGTGAVLALCLALLVGLLLIAGQRNEARRARDSAVAAVGVLAADLSTCRGNAVALQAGIDAQNRAVDDMAEAARLRQETGARALQAAQSQTRELVAQNGVLHDIINRTKPETCDATFDAARAGLRR